MKLPTTAAGFPASEISLAVERHATSKLERAADLFNIHTLGFRGEALASIGSVARLTITSRAANQTTGFRLRVEGGAAGAPQEVGAPVGTVIRVEELFYNVPARLKFLKSEASERQYIDNLVTRYALAYPRVRFSLRQEGRPALQTSGSGNRREALAALYGVEIAQQLLEVTLSEDGLAIYGFISPTSITRSNRRELHFYVNGRPIQDIALTTALLKAYHTLIMVGRFPLATLFLDLPTDMVDVNVHPTKAEVRFRQPDQIFSAVQRAVRRALLAYTPISGLTPPDFAPHTQLRWSGESLQPDGTLPGAFSQAAPPETYTGDRQAVSGTPASVPGLGIPRVPLLRLIGQIAATYLVAEGPDGLYLIDQHAAHERVLFEKFIAQQGQEVASQALLQPADGRIGSRKCAHAR